MTEAQIKVLKAQRANAKRMLTNFKKYIEDFHAESDYPILEKRMKELEAQRVIFDTAQSELQFLVEDPNHDDICTEFEEKYYSVLGMATARVNELKNNSSQPSVSNLLNLSTRTLGSDNRIQRKLPSLNLPTFNGSFETWLGFHDLFKSLIDTNTDITDIEKLYHLKGCLRDEAAELISSLELSADNYKVAWDLLKDRYDNRKVIRQGHIKALLNLPNISKEVPVRFILDQIQRHIRTLKALNEPVDTWDSLLIGIITQKLNSYLREKWEEFSNDSSQPTYIELISFLQRRAQFEDAQNFQKVEKPQSCPDKKNVFKPRNHQSCSTTVVKYPCTYCEGNHSVFSCDKFKKLTPQARFEASKKNALCINCLRKNHRAADCSLAPCRKCNQKHNIYLHFDNHSIESSSANTKDIVQTESIKNLDSQQKSSVACFAKISSEALLATAVVDLVNDHGLSKSCRVFLDAGSQANFITEEIVNFLKLPRHPVDISVSGINDKNVGIKHSVSGTIKSKFSKYQKRLDFLVLDQITRSIPSVPINHLSLEIPKNIYLADPQFYHPGQVDVLIGVQLFFKLMCVGQINIKNHPDAVFQKTQLGWIVAGELRTSLSPVNNVQCTFVTKNTELESNLSKFWEIEEIPSSRLLSLEELNCEEHFKTNTFRDKEGRYVVRLPFNEKRDNLGESRSLASRRLAYLIKRFEKIPQLEKDYTSFLDEYLSLNHMSEIRQDEIFKPGLYLSHHAVIKQESTTTKTRVVFDGSAKTSSGISLNESLMIGPPLQNDLFSLLLRFRLHRIVLIADIEKMYRQILVHPEDRSYQKILFRKSVSDPIKEFALNTITYGTSCAPYLAIRVLHQLAEDEKDNHPLAAEILKRDFYVDDLLTGTDTCEDAEFLRNELSILLKRGGFNLRKWASNEPSLVLEDPNKPSLITHMSLDRDSAIKTLGIQWDFRNDIIFYTVHVSNSDKEITKRSILSETSKLFDPLGLLGPVIITAKIMIQDLWKAGSSWDESVSLDIHTRWIEYKTQLPLLKNIRFDRFISTEDCTEIQIHGFCDASEKAYGACIYVRSTDLRGQYHVKLLCSKSKVAPVKTITLPRLELCAALLLSRLYSATKKALLIDCNNISRVYLWSDSTIVLQWLQTAPHTLKTFVSNRVSEIQKDTQFCEWKHVPSQENPADLVSRGKLAREFLDAIIWKNGPTWLQKNETSWPQQNLVKTSILEQRKIAIPAICLKLTICDYDLSEKYSSLSKLQRVVAYICRFVENTKKPKNKQVGPLSLTELELSLELILRMVQMTEFKSEIQSLKRGVEFNPHSKLIPLNPILDNKGILRVGGRLVNSELSENQKHPILLPSNHHVTRIIIRGEHLKLHHAGSQTTLYTVRENYWPLNGRNLTKKLIHECIKCFRAKPRGSEQIMGDLPLERVTFSRPFLKVGVDYCGPLFIKEKRLRNRNKVKVYIAIFVCMCTKAVHLEVVSDLTTETFIAALKRLFSRRGKAKVIFSDNGTNFVGANRELQELEQLFQSTEHNLKVQQFLVDEQILWKFIPPRAPHFGGLWEAAVKSFKHHLVRTVGDTLLTFEQLETYTIEIEAILNSRPLSPLSTDPNDLRPLTPGHFLIGEPLTSLPQVDFTDTPQNRLSNWQHAQQMRQHFWKRWQKEYLHQLQVRSKWQSKINSVIQPGILVIIKEDNCPPMQWSMGRITEVFPGHDGIIRVAKVKTLTNEYKRSIQRLCPLPNQD